MGHPARNRKKPKPSVSYRGDSTTVEQTTTVKPSVPLASQRPQVRDPQLDLTPRRPASESLAGLNKTDGTATRSIGLEELGETRSRRTLPLDLSDAEWDSLFCLAVRHHFDQGVVWVPSVLRTMALLEGINDKTGRPCRIYVRPGKRVLIVETLS